MPVNFFKSKKYNTRKIFTWLGVIGLLWSFGPQILLEIADSGLTRTHGQRAFVYGALRSYGPLAVGPIVDFLQDSDLFSPINHDLANVLKSIGPAVQEKLSSKITLAEQEENRFVVLNLGFVSARAFHDYSWLPFGLSYFTDPKRRKALENHGGTIGHANKLRTVLEMAELKSLPVNARIIAFDEDFNPDFVHWYQEQVRAKRFPPFAFPVNNIRY